MSSVEIRPATPELLRQFYGSDVPWTVRAVVGVRDGEVLGVGGYLVKGHVVMVFSDIKPGAPKKAIVRGVRATLGLLRRAGLSGIAVREKPESATFLEHFGFQEFVPGVYEWRS